MLSEDDDWVIGEVKLEGSSKRVILSRWADSTQPARQDSWRQNTKLEKASVGVRRVQFYQEGKVVLSTVCLFFDINRLSIDLQQLVHVLCHGRRQCPRQLFDAAP